MSLLSQNAKNRLLDEAHLHVQQHFIRDPAMPRPLRNLISALIRIFWVDFVQEFDESMDNRGDADDEGEGQKAELAELAAAPEIAMGMLQVLVVEARNLVPAHGIGTNPYARGMLGHQVRRSRTVWSTLSPTWNCIMDFPVVSMTGTLDLEIMSQAPLFGGDTRLGYISLPLQDVIGGTRTSQLACLREPLVGTRQGEVSLILDYKALDRRKEHACLGGCQRRLRRWAARFRAFFLYHYWPCDKSLFQMYLKEPIDISLLLLALSPFAVVRTMFYSVLLFCLCVPWPPDEHQIVQFILACKGTAVFTDGVGSMFWGLFNYYSCIRDATCSSGGRPGSSLGPVSVALDLYQEVLIWFVCFVVLPRTVRFGFRGGGSSLNSAGTAAPDAIEADAESRRGGRIIQMMKYSLRCFVLCLLVFLGLSAKDLLSTVAHGPDTENEWKWSVAENFFWCRVIFGLLMFPFCVLLHPQINKLLTHSTPTGYTRLGTLRRYRPRRKLRGQKSVEQEAKNDGLLEENTSKLIPRDASVAASFDAGGPRATTHSATSNVEDRSPRGSEAPVDPVGELKAVIKRFPGGSLALRICGLHFRITGVALRAVATIVSFEIRVASSAVSLCLRIADETVTTALDFAHYIPGSGLAFQIGAHAVNCVQKISNVTLSCSAFIVRLFPGGTTTVNTLEQILRTVGFLAAAAESPGLSTEAAPALLLAGTERAEALKLEAAAKLAGMLTTAETAAEWLVEREAAEAIHLVRPEISKIALALEAQRPRVRAKFQRVYVAGDALVQSLWAATQAVSARLAAASVTLVRTFRRELQDLRAQAPGRDPGVIAAWEAYSRLICSSACEAFLELRLWRQSPKEVQRALQHDVSKEIEATSRAQPLPESVPSLGAESSATGQQFSGASKMQAARPHASNRRSSPCHRRAEKTIPHSTGLGDLAAGPGGGLALAEFAIGAGSSESVAPAVALQRLKAA